MKGRGYGDIVLRILCVSAALLWALRGDRAVRGWRGPRWVMMMLQGLNRALLCRSGLPGDIPYDMNMS